jgi:hypothetical protein
MSELNEMTCDEFADVAAELALGVLTGRERALALEHLGQCESCRENVRQLTMTGEDLLGLLPAIEPPPGFETRVMDRIGFTAPSPEPDRRMSGRDRVRRLGMPGLTRRTLAAAAVVLAAALAGLGGWGLRAVTSPPAASASLSASALVSASHQPVGEIIVYGGSPRWVYMSVALGSGGTTGPVKCELVSKDGHVTTVGSFRLDDGYGSWGSPYPVAGGPLAGARLVSTNGTVLATASFSA